MLLALISASAVFAGDAVHDAICSHDVSRVKTLVNRANVNRVTGNVYPLELASYCYGGAPAVANYLLDIGADVNLHKDGYSALMWALRAYSGNEAFRPVIIRMIEKGADLKIVDATTGRQIWRTYLENANVSGAWIATTNLNILANGNLVSSWANRIALLDADTGVILKTGELPPGEAPPGDSSFKHLTVAPDGTLILKNQCRPTGATQQGSLAIFKGLKDGLKQANSIFVAVDPETLEVLDTLQMPEPATTPHGITMFDGRIAIYTCADAHAYRYFWDAEAKKLSLDESWVVPYLAEGQTTGDAPGIMGDWITIQTNGVGGKVPSSVVAM